MSSTRIKAALLILAVILLTGTVSACGGSRTKELDKELNEGGDTRQSACKVIDEPIADRTKELPEQTLTFLIPDRLKGDSKEVLDQVAAASKLNIKLDFRFLTDYDYYAGLQTAIASNASYDAFYVGRVEDSPFDYVEMARNGELMDITQLLPKYAPNIQKQLTTEEIEAAKVDGKLVVVPNLYPQATCLSAAVRKDLMDKYNLAPIKTFEDYGEYLKTVKNGEKNLIPGNVWFDLSLFAQPYGYAILDQAQGLVYRWDDPQMKVIPWECTPEYGAICGLVADWLKNNYIAQNTDGVNKERASFLGNSSINSEGSSKFSFGDGFTDKIYNLYQYPLYKDQKIQRTSPVGDIGSKGAIAFSARSQHAERTLMFLNVLESSQKLYDLFMHGIQGRHYILKGDRIKEPEGMAPQSNPYNGWVNSPFKNIALERLSANDDTIPGTFKDDYTSFIRVQTHYAPHEGFYPDYRQLKPQARERARILAEDFWMTMNQGNFQAADADSIAEKLKNAGTDTIVSEVQRQLDNWRRDHGK